MNPVEIVNAMRDGSAREADVKRLVEWLHRVLVRDQEQHLQDARMLLQIESDEAHCDGISIVQMNTVFTIAPRLAAAHLATVARLEAERDAALAAQNELEQRNTEMVAMIHRWQRATGCVDPDTIQDTLGRLADLAECRRPVEGIPDGIDRIKRQRDSLRAKLDRFDRVVERIVEVFDLGGAPTTDDIEPLRALLLEE